MKTEEHTGLSVSYYQVDIEFPTTPDRAPYTAECNDIIEALGMKPSEANIFKKSGVTQQLAHLARRSKDTMNCTRMKKFSSLPSGSMNC